MQTIIEAAPADLFSLARSVARLTAFLSDLILLARQFSTLPPPTTII